MGAINGYLYYPSFVADRIRLTIEGDVDTSDTPYVIVSDATVTLRTGRELGLW